MDIKNTLQFIESKKMKTTDFIYLGIILLFFTITIVLFFFSTKFIINNINKIFILNEENNIQSLDIEKYLLIEKRLNLPQNTTVEEKSLPVSTEIQNTIIQPQITETVEKIDKESIVFNILNSTQKAGVASLLSKKLEDNGFAEASTGNEKEVYSVTTIFIKDTAKEYTTEIQNIVKKTYPTAETKTIENDSEFDVIIIIGNK